MPSNNSFIPTRASDVLRFKRSAARHNSIVDVRVGSKDTDR